MEGSTIFCKKKHTESLRFPILPHLGFPQSMNLLACCGWEKWKVEKNVFKPSLSRLFGSIRNPQISFIHFSSDRSKNFLIIMISLISKRCQFYFVRNIPELLNLASSCMMMKCVFCRFHSASEIIHHFKDVWPWFKFLHQIYQMTNYMEILLKDSGWNFARLHSMVNTGQ